MKIFAIIKNIILISSIIFIFIDWKIAIGLFFISLVLYVAPLGPDRLLTFIGGALFLGAVIFLFFNWKYSAILGLLSFLIIKFRLWGNKINYEHYHKNDK